MDVIHTALWVADIERTKEFYVDGLGLEENWEFTGDDGVENVYVGGDHGEIQFKHGDDAAPEVSGIDHVAVSVDDTDAVFERLVDRLDPPVHVSPTTMADIGRRVAFVEDPDGYVVELVEVVG